MPLLNDLLAQPHAEDYIVHICCDSPVFTCWRRFKHASSMQQLLLNQLKSIGQGCDRSPPPSSRLVNTALSNVQLNFIRAERRQE